MKNSLISQLKTQEKFLLNTISVLTEDDSDFAPNEPMYTVAQQIGHCADTVKWFFDGAFTDAGFDMNFADYPEKMKKFTSFTQAVEEYKSEIAKAIKFLQTSTNEQLLAPIEGQIMNGAPKMSIIASIGDHTAHHRGALSVYARLLGKTPKMPYSE